ncbi:MAG: hypothetical protein AB1489_37835 [Acidobacteriota bacterium]
MNKLGEDSDLSSQLNNSEDATKFFLGARSALKVGDMRAAERLLRRALELSPKNYNYLLALARLLVQANKCEAETEELLIQASQINVTAVEPRLLLATMYEKLGKVSLAMVILKGVLNIDTTNFIAMRKLGQLNLPAPTDANLENFRQQIIRQLTHDQPLFDVFPSVYVDLPLPAPTSPSIPVVTAPLVQDQIPPRQEAVIEEALANFEDRQTPSLPIEIDLTKAADEIESPIANLQIDDPEITNYMASLAIVESIRVEITESLPSFIPELEDPEVDLPKARLDVDELGEQIEDALVTLDVDEVLAIIRQFFFAVEARLGRESALLLLKRSKSQLEIIYPALDEFEIMELLPIVEFISNDQFISARTLFALTTWMYLYITLLAETAQSSEAREQALEEAMPTGNGREEALFISQFANIQI